MFRSIGDHCGLAGLVYPALSWTCETVLARLSSILKSGAGQEETGLGLKKIFRVIKDVEVAAVVEDAELLASKLILDAWN